MAQFTIGKALEKVLEQLPTTGLLFPRAVESYDSTAF
jgi:hypothetical protein